MLIFFKNLSMKRSTWILLFISALVLESTALYFQHGMGLNPCVMCIYERVAILGILFSGLIGCIAPKWLVLRILALLIGLGSAVKGLLLAIKHLDYQLNVYPWNQCAMVPDFPQTLPLDKWFPNIFMPSGSCSDITWSFLGFSMVQWIIVIFACYFLFFIILSISQFKKIRKNRMLFR